MTNLENEGGRAATDETQQAAQMIAEGAPPTGLPLTGLPPAEGIPTAEVASDPIKAADPEAELHAAFARANGPKISVPRIVLYTLRAEEADKINQRRGANVHDPAWPQGAVAHIGNYAQAGDVLPMLVVKHWSGDMVNGQVFLDGNDSLWVTSVHEGEPCKVGTWAWPPRV